jgi:hypothetical protein
VLPVARVKGVHGTHSILKRGALAVAGAAVLVSATVGLTQAQAAPTADHQHKLAVIDLAAAKLGLTGDELNGALKQARKDLGQNQTKPHLGKLVHQELTVAAKAIGLPDARALRKELAGSTLTAVAQKHNVPPSTVASALKADVDAKIQALVTAGSLKADRGATLQQKAEAKVDALMTHQFKSGR